MSPIGDGLGTRKGCRTGCLIGAVGVFVLLALAAVVMTGWSAITRTPTSSTSTRSTP